METNPDLSSQGYRSSRRMRYALLIGIAAVLVAVFVGVGLAATRGGGSSDASAKSAAASRGANSGSPEGNSATTVAGSGASTTAPPTSKDAAPGSSNAPGQSLPTSAPANASTPGATPPATLGKNFGLGVGPYRPTGSPPPPPKAPPPVEQAYVTAFRAECESIWSIATSDGRLWDPDEDQPRTPYTINDCVKQLSPRMADFAFDEADARESGTADAMDAASGLGVLQNTPGTQKWEDPNWSSG
jgi:hypothetical protein